MGKDSGSKDYLIGVDLGGTKIMSGLFTGELECQTYSRKTTKAQKGHEVVVERIIESIEEVVEAASINLSQVKGIGIGAPGSVHPDRGTVLFAPNLAWRDLPLVKILEAKLKVPVFLDNDCNICTLGVHSLELKGKPKSLVGIFIGTGIGSGIVFGGRPWSGFSYTAGEIGHMVLKADGPKCGCGNRGCLEAMASRTAIFNRIRDDVKKGQKTILTEMLDPEFTNHRSGKLRKAIARGDKYVEDVVKEASRYIGMAVANVVNMINPEFVVLGGGLVEQLEDLMMGIICETAKKHAMPGSLEGVSIQACKLADDAGIVGGAALARYRLSQN